MSRLNEMWGIDKLPYGDPQAIHECSDGDRHLQSARWDLEGDETYTGLWGPAVTRIERWKGRWWGHNEEYATEVTVCPWCGERLD